MYKRVKIPAAAAAAMMLTISAARAEVKVGDQAPDFEMVGSDGKTYTSEQFKGEKVVVIAWYPKAFTGG
ncbi:MAG: redoxin domain-containing protein [Pirellulales bacterium]|nr:redoxin domain-containing protein [Pirellulales bacterium]